MAADGRSKHLGSRTNQLDSISLDNELHLLFKSQIDNCFQYLQLSSFQNIQPELTALLKLFVWKYSVISKGATVGQQLLDLEYRNEKDRQLLSRRKSWLLGILLIGTPWLKQRIMDNLLISNIYVRQVIQYEYMNRELLWHGFAEFLSFVLPIINLKRLKNIIKRLTSSKTSFHASERTTKDFKQCAICEQWPTFPHDIGCKHVFCYYCIMSNIMSDPNYQCPICNYKQDVISVRPANTV
ncbi:peroxisome biogenesis factor 2-like [Centruroides sculpturatus]|uniref:peroxisome biogenesis factor 2-like n=1 Tax=Centruroides sculpturatus TaxID=218467 RepID=UPI000C6E3151|nr:peroxisome biogenesis factor 2-like [Centruroides sculpturatus]